MEILYGLLLAVVTFIVLNLFTPAGWAAAIAIVVFVVVALLPNLRGRV